jgi:hypothetical protein
MNSHGPLFGPRAGADGLAQWPNWPSWPVTPIDHSAPALIFYCNLLQGRREGKGRMEISQQLAGISWVGPANGIIVSWGVS